MMDVPGVQRLDDQERPGCEDHSHPASVAARCGDRATAAEPTVAVRSHITPAARDRQCERRRRRPDLEDDVAFGLAASAFTERALASQLLDSWAAARSALREFPRPHRS